MPEFANPFVTLLLAQEAAGWFSKCAGSILTPLMPKGVLAVAPGQNDPTGSPVQKGTRREKQDLPWASCIHWA